MSDIIEKYMCQITNIMNGSITTDVLLDVETKVNTVCVNAMMVIPKMNAMRLI